MNRLEELAGELLELINGGSEQRVLEEAAAILLAASKADVAGLMALIKTVPPRDSWPERNAHMAQLESALRLLVAERDALRAGQDAEIDRLKAQVAEFGKDAALYQYLESVAKEKLLRPEYAACEYLPDRRTHWVLPTIMCSGPLGGFVSFREAIDTAMKEKP